MYELNSFSSLDALLSIILIIIFIVATFEVRKILNILEFFRDVELRKPENWYEITCDKCSGKISVSKADKGTITCPHCKGINRIPEK